MSQELGRPADNAVDGGTAAANEQIARRAVIGCAVGNVVEWYDYGVYGYVALQLTGAFFPGSNKVYATFLVFALTYAFRPIGGIIFGHIGDRMGRHKVLVFTIWMMALGTALTGILPTFAVAGVWAPILLIVCRLAQGFSTGGEYSAATTFLAEYAPDRKRGLFGSWIGLGGAAGSALGIGLVAILNTVLSPHGMDVWGWRIAFLVAAPLGAIGLYVRTRLEDTPVFQAVVASRQRVRAPLLDALRYPKSLVIGAAIAMVYNGPLYIIQAYTVTYLEKSLGMTGNQPLLLTLGVFIAIIVLVIPVGGLSDRIGRKPIMLAGCLGYLALTYPAYLLMSRHSLGPVILGLILMTAPLICFYGTLPSTLPELFPAQVRFSGLSLSYNLSTALFGGSAPYIANALISATGSALAPSYYILGCAAVALVPLIVMRESAGRSLRTIGRPPADAAGPEGLARTNG